MTTKRQPRKATTPELNRAPDWLRQTETSTVPGTTVQMDAFVGYVEDVPGAAPFVFDEEQVRDLSVGVRLDLNVLLTGPTGCGKTQLVRALAAHLNRPLIRFNLDGETRVSHLRGQQRPSSEGGVLTLTFSEGALVRAMRRGYWVLLDEVDAALPSVLMVLQPVLEEGSRRIYVPETAETVPAHPYFQVFATGNTLGYRASARAKHAGTNPANDAFLDRFGMVIACDYPSEADEIERITVNAPQCHPLFVAAIAKVATELRLDDKFRSDFSTRRCVQWARLTHELVQYGKKEALGRAFELAVVRKFASPTDAKVAREILQRVTNIRVEEKP